MHFKNWAAAFLLSQMAGVLASPADHEEPTGSFTLAPSPTGKVCQPHGDHCGFTILFPNSQQQQDFEG